MASLLGNTSVHAYGHRCSWQPAFRTTSTARSRTRLAVVRAEQSKQKIVAVLYKAGKAAENKDLLGCVENELGLREFLEEQVLPQDCANIRCRAHLRTTADTTYNTFV